MFNRVVTITVWRKLFDNLALRIILACATLTSHVVKILMNHQNLSIFSLVRNTPYSNLNIIIVSICTILMYFDVSCLVMAE